MVWGTFTQRGISRLAILCGNQDSTKYTQTLKDYLLPFAAQYDDGSSVFQQENTCMCISNETKQRFASQNTNVMTWPACSLDLNPIENLWGILARRVYADYEQCATGKDLKESILSEWERLDRNLCQKLVRTMYYFSI